MQASESLIFHAIVAVDPVALCRGIDPGITLSGLFGAIVGGVANHPA